MSVTPRHTRWVSADVEPGRSYGDTHAAIGVCEVWDSGTVGDSICFHLNSPTELREVWPFIAAYIGDSPLIFFNRAYDRTALAKWLARLDLSGLESGSYCALVAARQVLGTTAPMHLADTAARLPLFSDEERELRLRSWRDSDLRRGRPTLLDAGDDALASARLVRYLCDVRSESVTELFHSQTPRPIALTPKKMEAQTWLRN